MQAGGWLPPAVALALNNLFGTAINSDDLRVRAAGIEVDIAARNLEKAIATVDRLTQSGMLSARQRRSAVPRLLDFSEDSALDEQTRKWVFQALRDITGQTLPHDPAVWRNWYATAVRETN